MIAGKLVGHGAAQSEDRLLRVPYVIIRAENTPAALAEMESQARGWKAKADEFWAMASRGELSPQVAKRAEFCEEVLRSCAQALRQGEGWVIVMQARDGRVLGASQYNRTTQMDGMINLQAVAPENLVGTPGKGQLRGIGTSLVAAICQDFLGKGIESVWVKPFDEQAAVFWSQRGFGVCGAGGLLCVRGRANVVGLRSQCQIRPDSSVNGEYIVCGPVDTTMVTTPQ